MSLTRQLKDAAQRAARPVIKNLGEVGPTMRGKTDDLASHARRSSSGTKRLESTDPNIKKPGSKPDGNKPGQGDGKPAPKPKKPYSDPKRRPDYDPGQVDKVWKNSRARQVYAIENGHLDLPRPKRGEMWVQNKHGEWVTVRKTDPDGGSRPWDMGHRPGHEYRDLHRRYQNGEISKEEFLAQYRNHNNYQVEDPGRNRSHQDEQGSPIGG